MEEEVILSKIIEDARKEANRIIEEAEQQAKKIEEDNKNNALKQMQDEFEIIREKIIKNSVAELEKAEFDSRSKELIERKRIIEIVKEKVKQKINDLDEQTYIKIIDEKISKYKDMEDIQIILPQKYYEPIKSLAENYGMKVLEQTDEFETGVIVKSGDIEYNYNFEEKKFYSIKSYK